jgi:oxygen-independent coproporphyrinogen-3 oxidase
MAQGGRMSNQPTQTLSPRAIPAELSEKYSRSGPRYTSYPTAPQFKAEFDAEAVRNLWRESNTAGRGLSLYLHIPFCRKRCLYCGCHTTVCHEQGPAEEYVAALLREIDYATKLIDPARPLSQLALGGGTPTFLSPGTMARLVGRLKERFNFDPAGERSLEIDPQSVDLDYLSLLSELGFNRFSFGVQDFDPAVQQAIGRRQDEDGIRARIARLRELGHSALNIDLIYGLPRQTPETVTKTIATTVELRPSRIALFGYAHVPWVSPHQQALERHGLPSPAERMELFGLAFEQLLAAGYRHVGMDHFALPEDELITALESRSLTRNFMGYSTRRGLDQLALGASSISHVNTTFTQNEKDVAEYVRAAGAPLWIKGLIQTAEDRLRGEVILELMCNFYLSIPAVEEHHGIDFARHFSAELAELEPLKADGLVELNADNITVTELGRFFVRNICMPFDEYLKGEQPSTARYSRTV